ncbi:hypothetical protein [Anaerostipes butyraticus]|uniref:Uncharacterized protein n=1 Tax=Anaerostipes butyraticus TaxID=645466 RepID=A0A916VCB1_9FIRM|nr:hypothetical protein [Anaerostipes butyraticus]GFO83903.1 hypothetical protein ANBU17_02500 [Anaerostipes butyraticus]HJC83428.1 hypothetical protein [Candidatus Anaerostipes avicola]
MSEIFVEEENTVYELDEECMKRKEKMKQEKNGPARYRAQERPGSCIGIFLILLCCCMK